MFCRTEQIFPSLVPASAWMLLSVRPRWRQRSGSGLTGLYGWTRCLLPVAPCSQRGIFATLSHQCLTIQPLLDWVYSPPSKKKVFPLIKNVNSISLSAGNHNGDIVDFTIIGTDLAQGGGWT